MASLGAVPDTPDGSVNSSSLHKEGPVLCFFNKRLRALRKKYNRILNIEESKLKGKVINKEQEEVLQSKIGVAAVIEEFEKLKQSLSDAVKEEVAEREREVVESGLCSGEKDGSSANEKENSSANGETMENEDHLDREDAQPNGCSEEIGKISKEGGTGQTSDSVAIADLLKFIYFAQLFEVKSHEEFGSIMWTRMHERMSCLSYDYVTEDATDHLKEEDLDALAVLASFMAARPSNVTISHKDALQNCLHHARQWLCNSDQPIHPELPVSYSRLKERLNRIISSEYVVMTPELKILSHQSPAAAATDVVQYVPPVFMSQSSAEDGVLQMEAASDYFQHQSETKQQIDQDEESSNPGGINELPNTGGDQNSSFSVIREGSSRSDILQNKDTQIPVSPIPELKHEALSQLSEENEPHDQQQLSQPHHLGQRQQRQQSRQQQYYARNGGMFRGNHRSGQSMGYGRGGRGRGYINGRGNLGGRVSSYSYGYGQYYDQGNQRPRNYYIRRGEGGRSGGHVQAIEVPE